MDIRSMGDWSTQHIHEWTEVDSVTTEGHPCWLRECQDCGLTKLVRQRSSYSDDEVDEAVESLKQMKRELDE